MAQLNQVVSGALDRLHYEEDACVRYDTETKHWCYLHNKRQVEDFDLPQWAKDLKKMGGNTSSDGKVKRKSSPKSAKSSDSSEVEETTTAPKVAHSPEQCDNGIAEKDATVTYSD